MAKCTDEEFAQYIKESYSIASVFRKMGMTATGGNYRTFDRRVEKLQLDISHFTGQGHLLGKTHGWTEPLPLSEILVETSTYSNTNNLKKRLLKEGIFEAKCSACKNVEWQDLPIPLQLDHINGIRDDNRLENLRLLCPNCHAQTDTYCGKNIKRYKPQVEAKKKLAEEKREARRQRLIAKSNLRDKQEILKNAKDYKLTSKAHLRKVTRPEYDVLVKELESSNYCEVGRRYGVSDNAVRKWLNHYKKYMPH